LGIVRAFEVALAGGFGGQAREGQGKGKKANCEAEKLYSTNILRIVEI
jgi:hypothetical protein